MLTPEPSPETEKSEYSDVESGSRRSSILLSENGVDQKGAQLVAMHAETLTSTRSSKRFAEGVN